MHLLITGSNGFLGRRLYREFKRLGYIVTGYDLSNGQDICNTKQFEDTIQKCKPDTVIHLAAIADLYIFHKNPELGKRVNIDATHNMIKICDKLGIRFLFASTCCCYGNNNIHPSDEESVLAPTEPYANSKMLAEKEVLRYGLPHCSMRLATFYGPEMRKALAIATFMDLIYHEQPLTIDGDGKQSRTMTHVDDIVNGIITIATTDPKWTIVNITTEEEVSVLRMVEEIEKVCQKKGDITHGEDRSYQIFSEQFSNKRLRELGWKPKFDFTSGIEDTYEWYLKNRCKFDW